MHTTSELLIAPSILSADILHLADEVTDVIEAGADFLHVDVMDGHYVPNLTFGPSMVKAIKGSFDIPLDVHLMIENAEDTFLDYLEAGADVLTVHGEAVKHVHRIIMAIKEYGSLAGISINPGTPINTLEAIIAHVDLVLIMSVNPGFGGQSFIEDIPKKIIELKQLGERVGVSPIIEVDGGITSSTAPLVVDAGASMLVAGSAIFNQSNRKQAIASLRNAR